MLPATKLFSFIRHVTACGLAIGAASSCLAGEFSVSPIRADLTPGAPSETITVTNHAKERLRVTIRLATWTQDVDGKDVYTDSSELVYFPRQMDIDGDSRKVVRVGLKSPLGPVERAYRVFIEEINSGFAASNGPAVNFNFRFGVPVFVPPATVKEAFAVLEPSLEKGKVMLPVRNDGNQHARLTRIVVTDGAGFSKEIAGWYSLPNTERRYTVDVPVEVCRKARQFSIAIEGEGVRMDRQLHVDPANCG